MYKKMCEVMITERYLVSLYGFDSKYYTDEFVAYVWEKSANKEYLNSGIFVPALISKNRLVCGEIRGCSLGQTAYMINTLRIPSEVTNAEEFWNAYRNVLADVKKELGNPNMSLTVHIEDTFFLFIE